VSTRQVPCDSSGALDDDDDEDDDNQDGDDEPHGEPPFVNRIFAFQAVPADAR
jgi:hypothetical protein